MANNNQINFRGEVNEMSAAYFCRELETLPARSAANIYLHTPGGDIYAGGEMVNALRAALKRGCKINLEVGSLCASMGAALLAAAKASGCKATCHPNSEVMFHGCWTIMVGGADELTDQAKAMRDFNECVRKDLKKCGIEDTEEWFAADRQKWLNAEDLKTCGLVDEILDEASADSEDLKSDAVKIAALLNHPKENKMNEEPKAEEVKPEEAAPVAEPVAEPTEAAPAVEEAKPEEKPVEEAVVEEKPVEEAAAPVEEKPAETVAPTADEIEAKVTALANQRFAGLQAKHDQMIAGLKSDISNLTKERDEARESLAAANASVTSLQGDVEKLEHDLADVRDQLAKSESVRETVVTSALAGDETDNSWGAKYRAAKRSY